MKDIVHTLVFHENDANEKVNVYLSRGWKLLHVGPRLAQLINNEIPHYEVVYVIGATEQVYNDYKFDSENDVTYVNVPDDLYK